MKNAVKFQDGYFIVWGCFSYNGVGTLQCTDGTMDKYQYINILANNIATSSTEMMLKDLIFQQNNDPNASKYAKDYFRGKKTLKVLEWHLNHLI